MQENRAKKRKLAWILSLAMGIFVALLLFRSLELDEYFGIDLGNNPPVRFAKSVLLRSLVNEKELPTGATISEYIRPTMIYVLGGTQESLKWKMALASMLYQRGLGSRIVFMSVQRMTEYNPALGRNYTHDEWVTHVMMEAKVPATDIEFIAMPAGNFGTLSEARYFADWVKRRQHGRLILVTSAYHTRRVMIAFSHFLKYQGELYIYGSDEKVRFHQIITEYIKVLLYRHILIPMAGGRV